MYNTTNTAISISNLSKRYLIGKKKDGSLRGSLSSIFKTGNDSEQEFWALKDINFDIQKGDVIGIIGKNGAGKSTLLKILSQITFPTTGKIEINGRVASLLEVGTGFHPELTGRENIYLNGTILGMTRKEVATKFDEIVAFSGIEKFIDTPVKRYSSGMYVRLAFAVAAHLEPEILIIDEVLAVGDAEFQKKCLGKMKDVASEGRTVIFVSHDLEAVSSLCDRGILLNKGEIQLIDTIPEVLNRYNNNFQDSYQSWEKGERPGDETIKLNSVRIINTDLQQINTAKPQEKVGIVVNYEILKDNAKPAPNFHFFIGNNTLVFVAIAESETLNKGNYETTTWIPENLLNNDTYRIGVAFTTLDIMDIHLYEREIIHLKVIENKLERNSDFGGQLPGAVRPLFISNTKKIEQ